MPLICCFNRKDIVQRGVRIWFKYDACMQIIHYLHSASFFTAFYLYILVIMCYSTTSGRAISSNSPAIQLTGLEDCFNVLLLKLHRDGHIASHLLGENNTDQTTLDIMYKCIWFCQTAVRKPLQQLYNCCCKSFKETLRKSEWIT